MDRKVVKGELIAVLGDTVHVSDNFPDKTTLVMREDIEYFVVRFANGEQLWWSILALPFVPLVPFPDPDPDGSGSMPLHGFFYLYTVPISILVTSIVTPAAYHEYKLRKIRFENLAMYARYPQGFGAPHLLMK